MIQVNDNKLIVLIALLCSFFYCQGVRSSDSIDSLKLIYESSVGDSSKYEMLRLYEKAVRRKDRVAALPLMQERVRLAALNEDDDWLAKSLITLGNNYMYLTQSDSAEIHLDRALIVSKGSKNFKLVSAILNSKALLYQRTNRYEDAMQSYHEVIVYSDSLSDIEGKIISLVNLGALLMEQKDYKRALEYFEKVEEEYTNVSQSDNEDKSKIESHLAAVYTNIADCYQKLENIENAEGYFLKANSFVGSIKDSYTQIYYQSFIDFNIVDLAIKDCLTDNKCNKLKWNELLRRTIEAKEGFESIEYDRGTCFSLVNVGRVLTQLGDVTAAQDTLNRAIDIAVSSDFLEGVESCYEALAINSEKTSNYKSANEYLLKLNLVRDSIRNSELDRLYTEKEIKFETANKEKEIAVLALKNERTVRKQIQQLFGFVLATLLLLGGGYFFYTRYKFKKQKELSDYQFNVTTAMARFVPTAFLKAIGRDKITDVQLGDQVEKEVTVVFTDIRSFTTISEGMTPKQNFEFVKEYAGRMGPIIEAHGGFVNQYMGDGILAIFQDGVTPALEACIAMQDDIKKYNLLLEKKDQKPIRVGMGLHKGPLIMGIIGDETRRDATIISDAVNTAARIESTTKQYKYDILLSGEVEANLEAKGRFSLDLVGDILVKGRKEPVEIYALS